MIRRPLALNAQLVVVLVFVQLYSVVVGASYWLTSRAHADLEASFQRDLTVLTQLPRLRDRLRRLDLATDNFLLTGNGSYLKERAAAQDEVRRTLQELSGLLPDAEERRVFDEMERRLTGYLSEQGQWVSRRQAGRLSTAEAGRLVRRQGVFDPMAKDLLSIKDENVGRLEARRRASERAASATLLLILAAGLGAGGLIVFFLARFLVGPIRTLARYASSWKLGSPWDLREPPTSPELADLLKTLAEMTRRLNAQYEKEHELSGLKTQLVSMVSHEFNNALSVINGLSVLLQETEPDGTTPKRAQYYATLKSNVRSLGLASTNLLNMGRLESGKFAVRPRSTDLAAMVRDAAERLRLLWERKKLTLDLELPSGKALALADPEALTLVVTNLLGNAVKYTPEGGRVRASVERVPGPPASWRVEVRDTGIGLSREEQERVFSGFYRTESGQKAARGFGVGLAVAHSVVEAHGARLEVESEPGKGAAFFFSLPAADEPPAPAA